MNTYRAIPLRLLLTLVGSIAACADIMDANYATLAEAKEQGAMERGWIPGWLPPSATSIQEAHDLDTNESMLRFSVPVGTNISVPTACKRIDPRSPPGPPFSRGWWPGDVPASALATHRHAFFACDGFFVALSENLGEGFVWHRR